MNGASALPAEWFKKAEEDALSLSAVLKGGAPSTACFLSQQMAEKYLKGLLVFHGIEFPKTHDLLVLLSLVPAAVPDAAQLKNHLQLLNRYAIELRYPGDIPEVTRIDAEEASAAARLVKEFVREHLGGSSLEGPFHRQTV